LVSSSQVTFDSHVHINKETPLGLDYLRADSRSLLGLDNDGQF
jgi:hypothetical protein